jgi:glycosyltransferase involved in cell wall biosynthesis
MTVSLIIATYNQPKTLELLLLSVENQTKAPDEIIIADDGSNDRVKKIINNFSKKSNLKIKHSWQEDRGFRAAKSRNKAIAKSTSKYIVMVDGDIILHPRFIEDHVNNASFGCYIQGSRVLLTSEKTNEILINKSIKISFFSRGLSNRKNSIHSVFLSKVFNLFSRKTKKMNSVRSCNMGFYREDCIDVNGYNNDFEGWGREDSEFVARLFNSGIKRKNIRFNLIQYHLWHNESSREALEKNTLMLEEAINNQSAWCEDGINRYL